MCFLLCNALSQRAFVFVLFRAKMNKQVDFLSFTTGSRNREVQMLLKNPCVFEAAVFLTIKSNNFTQITVYFL